MRPVRWTLKDMKSFILGLLCFISLGSVSCTSQEEALKKSAIKYGEVKWLEALKSEADEHIKQSDVLHDGYIKFIQNGSEVQAAKVDMLGEDSAAVTMTINTYSAKMRRTLLEIAAKVDPSKSRRFNFNEAVKLVEKEGGESSGKETQPLGVYRFRKKDSAWVAQ